ncbi:protein FAR1-RELATED SEQUENCE 5-like [Carex rostrata]
MGIEYCNKHAAADYGNPRKSNEELKKLEELNKWDEKFLDIDLASLYEIIMAANYLNIEGLLYLAWKKVLNKIRGKSPEEIRWIFNIGKEFTLEEEEKIRHENEWAFERIMNLIESNNNDDIENEKLELMRLSFETSDELIKGTRDFFSERGYGLSIRGSRKDKYVVLGCDRGGCYRDQRNVSMEQRKRTTTSRLIGCPFKIKGKRQDNGSWMIEIKNYLHNHEASVDVTGHPMCRRLSQEEMRNVEHMSKSGIPPRQIISSLRQTNPKLSAISKTIYNAKTKIRKDNLAGRSTVQALLEELSQGGFTYDILSEGSHLTHLFFAHPLLVKLTQNFPNVFIMDCTYKTNRYKMPLLDIIGISSFNTSFYSGFAFLKRESEEDYIWALKRFSKIMGEKKPCVIITDREFALINAIKIVFPECKHLLCVWHIEKNILMKCKKYFETEEIWVGFLSSWKKVVYSSTELEYNEHWKEFESSYVEKKKALDYIENVWLPLKEKFVGAWTDEYLHFGNRASSRAESAHAKLKKYLQVSTGDLYEVQSKICLAIENEFNKIKASLSSEKIQLLHNCNTSFFKNVVYHVSIYALKELHKQHMKAKLGTMSAVCSGQFTKTMGLPCAHKMTNWRNEPLNLDLIHSRWRIDQRTLSAHVSTHKDDPDGGLSVLL